MRKLHNYLRGTLRIVISGAEPELFLNLCARADLPFWGVERREAFVLALELPRSAWKQVERIAKRAQCSVEIEARVGLPFFLLRFRRRYALILGLALFLAAFLLGSRMIWAIEIEGNVHVSRAEILSELRQQGIHIGIYGPSIEQRNLADKILLSMDNLSFFALNLRGTCAEVVVREKVPKPVLLAEQEPKDIMARSAGIITRIELFAGQSLAKVGDMVSEGELLVSGLVDIEVAPYSDADLGYIQHSARANIYARTWRTLEMKMPLYADEKCYDGEEMSRFAVNILGRRVKFYGNGGISFPKYDKISATKTLRRADGALLPFSLEKEVFRSYTVACREIALEEAEAMLQAELERALQAALGTEGEVLQRDFVSRVVDGILYVTLLAESNEQIGKAVTALPPPSQEEAADE